MKAPAIKITGSISLIIAALILPMLAGSCRRVENVVYSEFELLGSQGWDPARILSFAPMPVDSVVSDSDRFDLILTARYLPAAGISELPLEITEEDENGVFADHRLTLRLRDEKGNPRGRKSISLYEISDTVKKNFHLPDGYLIEIASFSPISDTEGLQSLGLTMTIKQKQR